ncbi:MAG: InlB B-repeat-containing protein [Lachnospiraceae bacterium]
MNSIKKIFSSLLLFTVMLCGAVPHGTATVFAAEAINDNETHIFTDNTDPIVVEGGSPTIVLNGADITASDAPAIWIKAGASAALKIEGENTLTGGPGFAAVCVEPSYNEANDWNYIPEASAKLTVFGSGVLTANGGNGDDTAGLFGAGSGIGGNGQNCDGEMGGVDFGVIELSEDFTGTIYAYGGTACASTGNIDGTLCSFGGGAGIGSGGFDCAGFDWSKVCGRISIHNGTVIANDSLENAAVGAGIGSGTGGLYDAWYTDFSDIVVTISGGDITAQGGILSAGIGGGSLCDGGNITISGGSVTAKAGAPDGAMGASGIGGGNDGGVLYSIYVTGGNVTAVASGGSAGIGGASNTSYSNLQYGDMNGDRSDGHIGFISISGEDTIVNAYGGTGQGSSGTFGGAGIGSGYPVANNARSVAFDISITGGAAVNAFGGYHAQAIGYGYRPGGNGQYYTGYGIKLVLDDTINLFAQNYDYYQRALVGITEYDANPITYSSDKVYLISYEDENRDADGASSSEAAGYLKWDDAETTKTFEWNNAENILSIDGKEIRVSDNLNGNWATLFSEPKKITISYEWSAEDKPEDVTVPNDDTHDAGTAYFAKMPNNSSTGYRFEGWFTDEALTQPYIDGSVISEDTILYGKWAKLYNIIYDSNGGTGTTTDSNSPYVSGSAVTVADNAFIRENYRFVGWNTAGSGNGVSYSSGNTIIIENDIILYAQWEKIPASAPGNSDSNVPEIPAQKISVTTEAAIETGDNNNLLLWIALIIAGISGTIGTVVYFVRRKKSR